MKINNLCNIITLSSIAFTLVACSGNPVDETDNIIPKTNVSAKKTAVGFGIDKADKKKPVVLATKEKAPIKVAAVKKPVTVVKKKPLTRTQSRAKKQSIAALGKSRQEQARLKNIRAQAIKKFNKNQLLEKQRVARNIAIAKNKAASAALLKARSAKRIATRAKQQPVTSRSAQPVRSRTQQPVRTRAKQPVRSRQYAARSKAPVRIARAQRPNRNFKRVSAVKRPAISRITPNRSFGYALSSAAIERTKHRVRYDGKYLKIGYPWGDVPKSIGVCTDVVIRAYRRLGIDLQQEVHKDISQDFYAYPNLEKWGLTKPDPNIDHRRVYNLQAFFKRHKGELPRSSNPRDYKPGDLVTWMVGPNFPHIGVVVNKPSKADPNRLMIAHNIGYGPKIEDILFRFPMTGHYRYTPQHRKVNPALLFAKAPPPASVLRKRKNSGLSYAEILQASKILTGKTQASRLPSISDLLVKNQKTKPNTKIMLAHLDATNFGGSRAQQDALKALLN